VTRRERLPHPASVQRELDRVLRLAGELAMLAEQLGQEYHSAYDASLSGGRAEPGPGSLGRDFAASDPTGNLATNGQLRTLRWRATKASRCLSSALALCEEGLSHLNMGYVLAFDEAEWARWLEKKLALEG